MQLVCGSMLSHDYIAARAALIIAPDEWTEIPGSASNPRTAFFFEAPLRDDLLCVSLSSLSWSRALLSQAQTDNARQQPAWVSGWQLPRQGVQLRRAVSKQYSLSSQVGQREACASRAI
jgi:hypothetical protein